MHKLSIKCSLGCDGVCISLLNQEEKILESGSPVFHIRNYSGAVKGVSHVLHKFLLDSKNLKSFVPKMDGIIFKTQKPFVGWEKHLRPDFVKDMISGFASDSL